MDRAMNVPAGHDNTPSTATRLVCCIDGLNPQTEVDITDNYSTFHRNTKPCCGTWS